jgi:hypothetical protein
MALSRTTVYVTEGCELRERSFVNDAGGACAWLEIGDAELGVWGSPAEMRRFAAAVTASADAADRLIARDDHAELAGRAAA